MKVIPSLGLFEFQIIKRILEKLIFLFMAGTFPHQQKTRFNQYLFQFNSIPHWFELNDTHFTFLQGIKILGIETKNLLTLLHFPKSKAPSTISKIFEDYCKLMIPIPSEKIKDKVKMSLQLKDFSKENFDFLLSILDENHKLKIENAHLQIENGKLKLENEELKIRLHRVIRLYVYLSQRLQFLHSFQSDDKCKNTGKMENDLDATLRLENSNLKLRLQQILQFCQSLSQRLPLPMETSSKENYRETPISNTFPSLHQIEEEEVKNSSPLCHLAQGTQDVNLYPTFSQKKEEESWFEEFLRSPNEYVCTEDPNHILRFPVSSQDENISPKLEENHCSYPLHDGYIEAETAENSRNDVIFSEENTVLKKRSIPVPESDTAIYTLPVKKRRQQHKEVFGTFKSFNGYQE
jgi:hypothetical protein